MKRLILTRLVWLFPTLWIIATLTFLFLRLIPGGPFDRDRKLPPEIQANLEKRYGLDQPLMHQYGRYLARVSRGDLGPSLKYLNRNTNDIIRTTLPVSLTLGSISLILAALIGIPLGILTATVRSKSFQTSVHFALTLGISLPPFVLAAALILIFSFTLKLLPPALWEGPRYMIMPALTLAVYPACFICRLTSTSLTEIFRQEFILTARAKGLHERVVVLKHALLNCLQSVVSILGPIAAALLTGSFIVEYIFVIPGMGQYFVTAVTNRDYPLVLGVTLVYGLFVLIFNFLVDLAYTWLDPRVRIQ